MPEVLVTLGQRGAIVFADGVAELVRARRVDADPTGAGDSFAATYLAARSRGNPADGRRLAAQRRSSATCSRAGPLIAHVQTADGLAVVDLEEEVVLELDPGGDRGGSPPPELSLPLVVAAARVGSTIVAVVDTKPPLVVSHDSGRTWRESGRGLPAGRAVAISPDDPDIVLYAARNRLYLSRDGGRFWRVGSAARSRSETRSRSRTR